MFHNVHEVIDSSRAVMNCRSVSGHCNIRVVLRNFSGPSGFDQALQENLLSLNLF